MSYLAEFELSLAAKRAELKALAGHVNAFNAELLAILQNLKEDAVLDEGLSVMTANECRDGCDVILIRGSDRASLECRVKQKHGLTAPMMLISSRIMSGETLFYQIPFDQEDCVIDALVYTMRALGALAASDWCSA
jgi:hypothetical protein